MHRFHENVSPQPDRFYTKRWLEEKGTAERDGHFFAFAVFGGRGKEEGVYREEVRGTTTPAQYLI